jgi:hypothetical protein
MVWFTYIRRLLFIIFKKKLYIIILLVYNRRLVLTFYSIKQAFAICPFVQFASNSNTKYYTARGL